jgi:acyl-coenzyme A thioesterase PaaI-like protein
MTESLATRLQRHAFNLFPAYFGTGARIVHIARDWREVRVELPLTLRTRNYVGTLFGGSMYGAVDPVYMIMLIKTLGPGYVVWDKSAAIRFLRPGRSTLHARFRLEEDELRAIRSALEAAPAVERVYAIELVDEAGQVCARVEQTVHVAMRAPATASPGPLSRAAGEGRAEGAEHREMVSASRSRAGGSSSPTR